MDKLTFVQTAEDLTFKVGETNVSGQPRQFKAKDGKKPNVGWNIAQKVTIILPDGTKAVAQFNGNVSIIGSKDWPELNPNTKPVEKTAA